jgi:hypothetical protein
MSFSNLRQARQTKESKSYVKIGQFTVSDDSKVTTPVEGPSGTMALDGLYKHIPSIMMIRSSTTSGRGIWAKEMQKAGAFISQVCLVLSN